MINLLNQSLKSIKLPSIKTDTKAWDQNSLYLQFLTKHFVLLNHPLSVYWSILERLMIHSSGRAVNTTEKEGAFSSQCAKSASPSFAGTHSHRATFS